MARGPFYAPGNYFGAIEEIGFDTSKSGKDMIVVIVTVTDELPPGKYDYDDAFPVANQYRRTIRMTIGDDRSLDYIMAKLRNAGWTGTSFAQIKEAIGNRCQLKCEHEEYQNSLSEQWDLMLPPRNVSVEAAPDVAMKLDALFDRRLREQQAATAPAPAQRSSNSGEPDYGNPPPAGPNGKNDDIPF